MPYDSLVMTAAAEEVSRAAGARVTKVYQPATLEVVLRLRRPGFDRALVISAAPESSRLHLTNAPAENPKFPPAFCMLLRKHLEGARLSGVEQAPFERILRLRFDARDDLGVPQEYSIIAEIMGRRSNIVLVDASGTVVDAVRRAALDVNRAREVMPGRPYSAPPARQRIAPVDVTPGTIESWANAAPGRPLDDILVEYVAGVGPALARHVVRRASARAGCPAAAPTPAGGHGLAEAVADVLREVFEPAATGSTAVFAPVVYWDGARPVDYYCFPLDHLDAVPRRAYATMGEAIDAYYMARTAAERFESLASSLRSVVKRGLEKAESRLQAQQEDMAEGMKAEQYRLFGELLTAYGRNLPKSSEARLPNYYVEGSPEVAIPLDPSLEAHANAAAYYRKYAKAKTAREQAATRMARTREETAYLEQVAQTIDQASGERDLAEIREELAAQGYLPARRGPAPPRGRVGAAKAVDDGPRTAPISARSSEGFEILVGRNNSQNDMLWRAAKPDDVWLHAKNTPGAHVILRYSREAGKPPEDWPPERSLLEAAALAAYYSRGRSNAKVQVDYTLARHVWKPRGAKPGMVLYDHERTLVVRPRGEPGAAP